MGDKRGSSWRVLPAIVACPCLLHGVAARGAAPQFWTLENEQLAVTLSGHSAAIVTVEHKANHTTYTNPAAGAEIIRVRIPVDDWDGHSAAGSQAERFRVQWQSADSLVLTATRFTTTAGGFPIRMEIHCRLEGDNFVTRLRVTNGGTRAIDQIAFPMLDVGPAADGSETIEMTGGPARLRELFSQNTVRTHHDPFERLDPQDMRGWIYDDPAFSGKAFEYPSGFFMHSAWLNYRAGDIGVGWDVRDRSFQSQYAVVERQLQRSRVSTAANRQTYRLSWRWFPLIRPGESWESPEVYLKFGSGDWHGVARQHRDWLQTWLQRPVVAAGLRSSIGWISRGITSYAQIPAIARTGVEVGAPYFIVYGWYGSGMHGLSYDYFPQAMLGGESSLRENLKAARALGAYPLAWYNGTTTSESALGHQERGRDWVVMNRQGGRVLDGRWSLFDPDRPPTTDDATILLNYDMGTAATDFNLENVRRLIVDYGFAGFEMDQGAKNYLAYTSGDASQQPELRFTQGERRFYEGARRIVKEQDANGVVLGEGISDFMNQYVDSSWTFEGGSVSVPLHRYYRYSLPWATLPAAIFTPDPGYANQAFLMNSPLDIFLDLAAYPEFVQHLKRLHALKIAVHSYLFDGNYSDDEGFALQAGPATTLLAKSYIGPGRRTTVVVVNAGGSRESATLDIAGADGWRVTNLRLDGSSEPLASGSGIPLNLGPHDINVVIAEQDAGP
jgi:hypothetical protein